MAENETEELHCPWCRAGLGMHALPDDGSVIECPGCHERFQAEPPDEDIPEDGDVGDPASEGSDAPPEGDFPPRGVPQIPRPRKSTRLPPESDDSSAGWSKWEFSSPNPRQPGFERAVRQAGDAARLPSPLIQDLAQEKKRKPKFSELGRTHLPEEREIDAEQRRRREVLQKGWESLADPATLEKGPRIPQKDALRFERNLVQSLERASDGTEAAPRRRRRSRQGARETAEGDVGGFTVEGMERAQRIRSLLLGLLGTGAALGSAIGLFIGVSRMLEKPPSTAPAAPSTATPLIPGFSVSSNYSLIISRLREFLEAEDVDALLQTVRNRQAVEPLIREYYNSHPYSRRLLREVPSQDAVLVTNGFAVVTCVVEKGQTMWVPMEIAAGLKIDWKAAVGHSAMEWEEFARVRPKEPTLFRARIAPVSYYSNGFTEEQFYSVQVSDTNLNHVFYGYIPRRGPLAEEFGQLLPEALGIGAADNLRAVVELRFPAEESAPNQVEIVSLKARGWIFEQAAPVTSQALELFANDARIDGAGARLDENLHIVEWDDESTALEWRVHIEKPVRASVFANLANGGAEGKFVVLSTGPQQLSRQVPASGGWDIFHEVAIGELEFPSAGSYTLRLNHDVSRMEYAQRGQEPLLILDKLILRGETDLSGSRVRDPQLKPLVHPIARLSDEGHPGNTLTTAERGAGWRMLFNGRDLKGWTGFRSKSAPHGWKAEANQLVLVEPGCGPIMTTKDFENFELKLEWQTAAGEASGVFLRVAETKPHVEETAIEIELNGHGHAPLPDGETSLLTTNGSVKRLYPPLPFEANPAGWNTLRVRFMDDALQYWINDQEMGITDSFGIVRPIEIKSDDFKQRVDDSRFRRFQLFAAAAGGYIALEDAGTPVRFRNIKVLELEGEEYRQ